MKLLLRLLVFFIWFTAEIFAQGSYLNILGIIRGDSAGAQFGKKVVPAGDVNSDSLPDFLVGAFGDDPIYPYSGPIGTQKVYLFFGKKGGLDTIPDLVFFHKAQLDWLGDINGDGGLDYAMRESGQSYRLSVYLGGRCLDTIPDGYIKGDSLDWISDAFGLDISAGRLSSVGNTQIMVGKTMPRFDSVRFFGYNVVGNSIDSLAFWKLDLVDRVGFPAGPAQVIGDINGDGYDDLAIGRATASDTVKGQVEIYLGGTSFDTIPNIIIHPPPYLTGINAGYFGSKLGAVGDLDGDGFSDFVIGVSRTPLLYFGGNPLDTLPRFTLDRIGDHFVNGGDINHDGYTDLLVGRDEHPLTGFAYVYYGGPTMDSIRDLEIKELDLPTPADGFGQTVAGLGDIDGDGTNDFAVGSRSSTFDDQDWGYLWIFNGLTSTGFGDEKQLIPRFFTLAQNYPNPFNANTVISYTLSHRVHTLLEIFNIAGQRVKVLVNQEQSAGRHEILWDGRDSLDKPVASGIYFYRVKAVDEIETKKMMLIR